MGANGAGPSAKQAVRVGPSRKPGAGRRRDPTIDDRLRHAARALYGREGWAGFHFEGVAKAAAVSKDAVYRRYSDAQSLLLDALSDQVVPGLADDRPIEDALVAYACDAFRYFASGIGNANLRVHVDGGRYPEVLQEYRKRVVEPQIEQAVGVLERARRNGEIHVDASSAAVIEALGGAVMVYALASSWRLDETDELDPATVRQLTDFVQQILYGRLVDRSNG
ncbi:TetR/AcrR family transcriptional regulator [Mycobacterium sp.]|uniref:TetR/AcrR family transcriptional regulator n=1 Tax=Mycobacterium sp. TaxID=1785 RepID=UPI001216E02C|nr:TetR/AcrR family transcriptional regulator [Mycobacterium sp.]TAM65259.1 MAG: TetR/AcrR family transcriptional regulator [Mycobacterium sp.]